MKLSDVMSAANLAIYAEVGLLIFFLVFVAVAVRVLMRRPSAYDEVSRIPLSDEPVVPRTRRPSSAPHSEKAT